MSASIKDVLKDPKALQGAVRAIEQDILFGRTTELPYHGIRADSPAPTLGQPLGKLWEKPEPDLVEDSDRTATTSYNDRFYQNLGTRNQNKAEEAARAQDMDETSKLSRARVEIMTVRQERSQLARERTHMANLLAQARLDITNLQRENALITARLNAAELLL